MFRYILRRLLLYIPVLLLVTVVVFSIVLLLPGDPAHAILGEGASPSSIEALRERLQLDEPIYIQYLSWLGRAIRGDLGESIYGQRSVTSSLLNHLPPTFQLTLMSMLVGMIIGFTMGITSALRPNSKIDAVANLFAFAGAAVPSFWLGILLILAFALALRWLPPFGYVSIIEDPIGNLKLMIMPAMTMGTHFAAVIMRQVRGSLLEVLHEDYILTARSKGLRERIVVIRHALKNALIPVVTIIGLQMGYFMGGAVVVETIFAIPGVGRLGVQAIFDKDFPIVQGVMLLMALSVLTANLVVDILYAYIDPRIKYD